MFIFTIKKFYGEVIYSFDLNLLVQGSKMEAIIFGEHCMFMNRLLQEKTTYVIRGVCYRSTTYDDLHLHHSWTIRCDYFMVFSSDTHATPLKGWVLSHFPVCLRTFTGI